MYDVGVAKVSLCNFCYLDIMKLQKPPCKYFNKNCIVTKNLPENDQFWQNCESQVCEPST